MSKSVKSDEHRNVPADTLDLRDQLYMPTLRPLLPSLSPAETVLAALKRDEPLYWLPRSQGSEGTCSAQAAATLIDLQRMLNFTKEEVTDPVSARMLFQMASQTSGAKPGDGVSLRDVIKGFYHHGVCTDALWKYQAGDSGGSLNVERAKNARQVSLGAYYRLRANLNDYHAALNEVGPVLVSAGTHLGWNTDAVRKNQGHILPAASDHGGHAFVVIGYDSTGFLVLNSWGTAWGGFDGCAGLGHWLYDDWADSIYDGWVLRLGVSTPAAFAVTVGEQGLYFRKHAPNPKSTPAYEVQGHLIHLDDGVEVARTNYPYDAQNFAETCRYLRRDDGDRDVVAPPWDPSSAEATGYRGILLKFSGSLLGLDDIAAQIAREKKQIKKRGLYPVTVAWCNDFVEKTTMVLTQLFTEATKQTEVQGTRLDGLIEDQTHGIGRAFWRDVERASEKSTRVNGPIHSMVRQLLTLKDHSLHIVCDGAGVLLVRDLIASLKRGDRDIHRAFLAKVETIDLITPVIEFDQFDAAFSGCFQSMTDRKTPARTCKPMALYVPSAETEAFLRVGVYSKSILHLIENAFCERSEKKRPCFIGKSLKETALWEKLDGKSIPFDVEIVELSIPCGPGKLLRQEDLYEKSDLLGKILQRVAPLDGTA